MNHNFVRDVKYFIISLNIIRIVKQVTLHIKENKFAFFMELIKNLDFVKIDEKEEGDSKEAILNNLKTGLEEVKQFKAGKLKTTTAKAFLNEL